MYPVYQQYFSCSADCSNYRIFHSIQLMILHYQLLLILQCRLYSILLCDHCTTVYTGQTIVYCSFLYRMLYTTSLRCRIYSITIEFYSHIQCYTEKTTVYCSLHYRFYSTAIEFYSIVCVILQSAAVFLQNTLCDYRILQLHYSSLQFYYSILQTFFLWARSRGPSATAGLLVFISEVVLL